MIEWEYWEEQKADQELWSRAFSISSPPPAALQCRRCSLWEKTLSPAPAKEPPPAAGQRKAKKLGSNKIFDKKQESREKKQFASGSSSGIATVPGKGPPLTEALWFAQKRIVLPIILCKKLKLNFEVKSNI